MFRYPINSFGIPNKRISQPPKLLLAFSKNGCTMFNKPKSITSQSVSPHGRPVSPVAHPSAFPDYPSARSRQTIQPEKLLIILNQRRSAVFPKPKDQGEVSSCTKPLSGHTSALNLTVRVASGKWEQT